MGIQMDRPLIDAMLETAMAECAFKLRAGEAQAAHQEPFRPQCADCQCVAESLARTLGAYLGAVDRTVKAVYHCQPVGRSSRDAHGDDTSRFGINLVVWVERKSAALQALSEMLQTALKASRGQVACGAASPACLALDVNLVADSEVLEGRCFGLLVQHEQVRTLPVWVRAGPPTPGATGVQSDVDSEPGILSAETTIPL
jgi:hypothetical protein